MSYSNYGVLEMSWTSEVARNQDKISDVELDVRCLQRAFLGFSDDQTKLKWHIDQVGPTKFDSFKKENVLLYGNKLHFWSYSAQLTRRFCLWTEKQAFDGSSHSKLSRLRFPGCVCFRQN